MTCVATSRMTDPSSTFYKQLANFVINVATALFEQKVNMYHIPTVVVVSALVETGLCQAQIPFLPCLQHDLDFQYQSSGLHLSVCYPVNNNSSNISSLSPHYSHHLKVITKWTLFYPAVFCQTHSHSISSAIIPIPT